MSRRRPTGFTLVELLVVITIIVILIGLLIPAVGMAVRAARKKQCANNQRQVAAAIIQFEEVKRRYPGSREIVAKSNNAALPGRNKEATWCVMVMQYVGEKPLWDRWNDPSVPLIVNPGPPIIFNVDILPRVPLFVCPSDVTMTDRGQEAGGEAQFQLADTSYVANGGFMPRPSPLTDPAPFNVGGTGTNGAYYQAMRYHNGIFHDLARNPRARVTLDLLEDGATNTMLISENLEATQYFINGPIDSAFRLQTMMYFLYANDTPVTPTRMFGGSPVIPTSNVTPVMKINGNNSAVTLNPALGQVVSGGTGLQTARPSSAHSGGVNIAFADGHTEFIGEDIDYRVYQAMMTPVGAKSDMPHTLYLLKADDYKNP